MSNTEIFFFVLQFYPLKCIATTTANPCPPTAVGTSNVLLNTSYTYFSYWYTCYAYNWTASTTGLVTLTFNFLNPPDFWYLDNVTATNSANTQLLGNSGFENGTFSPWTLLTPNATCTGIYRKMCTGSTCYSGTSCFCDASSGCIDQLSQQFSVVSGQTYVIKFYLRSGAYGSNALALVTVG